MSKKPNVAIIGLGGFAGTHHLAISELEAQGECRVVCTCDPFPENFSENIDTWAFAARGVKVYKDYLEMLDAHADELDMVTIPTPVPLHAPMHQACIDRGLTVYLEKPPTLNWAELQQMLAVEERAAKLTNVGFNYIIEEPRQALKQRLLSGEFGALERISLLGLWARAESYYQRSSWAGRLRLDGQLVLDSCMGNAISHQVHDSLFWAGQDGLWSWGSVDHVRAELYRAHDIECLDTVFAAGQCPGGPELRLALTHACAEQGQHEQALECEKATIRYVVGNQYTVEWRDGRREEGPCDQRKLIGENLRAHIAYIRGERPRPVTRLVDCIPFVQLYNLCFLASGRITTVAAPHAERLYQEQMDSHFRAISGIAEAERTFIDTGALPSAQGLPWAVAGGEASAADLPGLDAVVDRMLAAREDAAAG